MFMRAAAAERHARGLGWYAQHIHIYEPWQLIWPTATRVVQLFVCSCAPACEQLLARGYFPCAPKSPSMAFSTALLEFISIHSLNVAPNSTAWSHTLETFWSRRGAQSRLRVSSSLSTSHQSLTSHAGPSAEETSDGLDVVSDRGQSRGGACERDGQRCARALRTRLAQTSEEFVALGFSLGKRRAEEDEPIVRARKRVRLDDAVSDASGAGPGARPRTGSQRASVEDVSEEANPASGAGSTAGRRTGSQRARVEDVAEEANPAAEGEGSGVKEDDGAEATSAARQRPSEGLRRKCPLCFGGARPKLKHTE